MIKSEIRSLIKNLLPKYGFESEFHDRFIDASIEKTLALFYNYVFTRDSLELQRYCKRYGGITPIVVSQDINANIYYSTYPVAFIPFADKASGIRRVTQKVQSGIKFYPMDEREVELVSNGSYFANVNSKIGYVVTQDRLEYYGMTAAIQAVGVRLDMVIPFSVYAETDTVLIPEITDPQGKIFTDIVMAMLSVVKSADLSDDNNSASQSTDNKGK